MSQGCSKCRLVGTIDIIMTSRTDLLNFAKFRSIFLKISQKFFMDNTWGMTWNRQLELFCPWPGHRSWKMEEAGLVKCVEVWPACS